MVIKNHSRVFGIGSLYSWRVLFYFRCQSDRTRPIKRSRSVRTRGNARSQPSNSLKSSLDIRANYPIYQYKAHRLTKNNLVNSMNKILFLCTGNYYRSRFAEHLFNWLATKQGLDWQADSRGLALERGINSKPKSFSPESDR